MRLSRKNYLLTLLGISTLLIFFRFSILIAFPDALTLERGDIQKIYPGQTLSQTFVAKRNNLETIQILLRTPGVKDGDRLRAKLADATCTDILAEGTFETPFLNTDNMYVFTFPRRTDSEGETLCLLLSLQTNNTKTKYLRLFTTPPTDTTTPLLNAATKEPLNRASLSLRTVYRNDSLWQDLSELNDRISQYKPWFLKDFFIGTLGLLFITLSITLIAILIISAPLQKNEKP
jgi:hypothetical protein